MLINWDFFDPLGRGFGALGAPCLCHFSLLRQRKVTKRKATPTRRAVLSGRHKVAAWAQGRPAPCALGPRHGITAGLCPSERASNAAVGASGGWFSAGALRCRTGRLWRWESVPAAIVGAHRYARARGACGGVPHARSTCINNQVLITRLYY